MIVNLITLVLLFTLCNSLRWVLVKSWFGFNNNCQGKEVDENWSYILTDDIYPINACLRADPNIKIGNPLVPVLGQTINNAVNITQVGDEVHLRIHDSPYSCSGSYTYHDIYPTNGTCFLWLRTAGFLYAKAYIYDDFPVSHTTPPGSFLEFNIYSGIETNNCTDEMPNSLLHSFIKFDTCSTGQTAYNISHDFYDYMRPVFDVENNVLSIIYHYDDECTEPMKAVAMQDIELNECLPIFGTHILFRYHPNELPSHVLPFEPDGQYLMVGVYHNDYCYNVDNVNNEVGGSIFLSKTLYPLSTCTNHQIRYGNEEHMLVFVYHKNDEYCEDEYTIVLRYLGDITECNPFYYDDSNNPMSLYWVTWFPQEGISYQLYFSGVITDDVSDLKKYLTFSRNKCGNVTAKEKGKLKLRYSDYTSYLHDDYCIYLDEPDLSVSYGDDLDVTETNAFLYTSYKGFCRNGNLFMRNYTNEITCIGYYEKITEDICVIINPLLHYAVSCTQFWCFGFSEFSSSACSGNGYCSDFDVCTCSGRHWGYKCQWLGLIGILEHPLFWVVVGIVIALLVVLVLFVIIIVVLVILFFSLRKINLYKGIDDIDILLNESRASKRGDNKSMAKIKIDKKKFVVKYKDLKVDKKIGEGGSSSVVFLCKYHNVDVAFKCFKTSDICSSQESFDEFEREVSILANVSHPNILHFYGGVIHPPRVGIICEFCPNGDLKEFFEKNPEYGLRDRIRLLREIASAMEYLHSVDIIHRDLKCENVLLTKGIEAKVMDFGLSKIVNRLSNDKTRRVGTTYYMAPEMVKGEDYSEKVDVWSYSIVIWEVLHGNFKPYGEYNVEYGVEFKVANDPNMRPSIDESKFGSSKWLVSILKKCWEHNAANRPSFKSIVEAMEKNQDVSSKNPRIPDSFQRSSVRMASMTQEIETLKEKVSKFEKKYGKIEE